MELLVQWSIAIILELNQQSPDVGMYVHLKALPYQTLYRLSETAED